MSEFWSWLGSNGLSIVGDVIIPVAAILVSTMIALKFARQERKASEEGERRSRRLQAGADVLSALAPMISANPDMHDMHGRLASLRASIAIYRAWVERGDTSGDWLALKHEEGMKLWEAALSSVTPMTPEQEKFEALDAPRGWAAGTIDMFSRWLSGAIGDEVLRASGALVIESRDASS